MSQTQQASRGPSSQQTFNPSVNYCLDFITKLENRSAMVLFQSEAVLTIITIYIGILTLFRDILSSFYGIPTVVSALLGAIIGAIISKMVLHILANKALWALMYCDSGVIKQAMKIIGKVLKKNTSNHCSDKNFIKTCIKVLIDECKNINCGFDIPEKNKTVDDYVNGITELYGRIGTNFKKLSISIISALVVMVYPICIICKICSVIIFFICPIMKEHSLLSVYNIIVYNIINNIIIYNIMIFIISAILSGILYILLVLDK